MKKLILKMCTGVCVTAISLSAMAMEKVSVAIGQKGLWDTMVTLQGIEQGFFKKEGLDVEVTWTKGWLCHAPGCDDRQHTIRARKRNAWRTRSLCQGGSNPYRDGSK
jgi:hypothetical protein